MLTMSVKGITKLQKDLGAETKAQKRALNVTLRVEGWRLLKKLRHEMREGTPGGHPYHAQLSRIARRTRRGHPKKNQIPLSRLSRLLRYDVEYVNGELNFALGFVSPARAPLSGSWKKLILKHQGDLHDTVYSGSRRELGRNLARIGGRLKKKNDPDARFFFLRSTTGRRLHLPKRPMIDPFWDANAEDARRNIRRNFRRKMRGERI